MAQEIIGIMMGKAMEELKNECLISKLILSKSVNTGSMVNPA